METFCYFIEILYDPYFTWRNFLRKDFCDFKRVSYQAILLNVEIVPFIYDCFQNEKLQYLPVGSNLIHILGAIISGSQVTIKRTYKTNK